MFACTCRRPSRFFTSLPNPPLLWLPPQNHSHLDTHHSVIKAHSPRETMLALDRRTLGSAVWNYDGGTSRRSAHRTSKKVWRCPACICIPSRFEERRCSRKAERKTNCGTSAQTPHSSRPDHLHRQRIEQARRNRRGHDSFSEDYLHRIPGPPPDEWQTNALPALRKFPVRVLMRLTNKSESMLRRTLAG